MDGLVSGDAGVVLLTLISGGGGGCTGDIPDVGDGVVEHLHDGQPICPTQNLYNVHI